METVITVAILTNSNKYQLFIKTVIHRYFEVSEASLNLLYNLAEVHSIEKGEILLPFGRTAKNIYLLFEGVIVSNFLDSDGKEYHKNIFLKGDFVASTVSYLTQQPSQFSLEAVQHTTLIGFNYKKYRELIEANNDLKSFYVAYLEKNWVIDKERREIALVLKEAKERYLEYINANPGIEDIIPLHYIASHLGITPTQLSRIRKNLNKNPPNQHM